MACDKMKQLWSGRALHGCLLIVLFGYYQKKYISVSLLFVVMFWSN